MAWSTHFDANGQFNDLFSTPIDIFPGDRVITTCIYNTSGATLDVLWGPRKSQEMCVATLYYYPAEILSGACVNLQGPYQNAHILGVSAPQRKLFLST